MTACWRDRRSPEVESRSGARKQATENRKQRDEVIAVAVSG
jgi:hypothetical protein